MEENDDYTFLLAKVEAQSKRLIALYGFFSNILMFIDESKGFKKYFLKKYLLPYISSTLKNDMLLLP
jgi:hypothetical protein